MIKRGTLGAAVYIEMGRQPDSAVLVSDLEAQLRHLEEVRNHERERRNSFRADVAKTGPAPEDER